MIGYVLRRLLQLLPVLLIASAAIWARDFRARSVADFSCPQAAMISSPRGVRMGEA